jgi:hypothetical protein
MHWVSFMLKFSIRSLELIWIKMTILWVIKMNKFFQLFLLHVYTMCRNGAFFWEKQRKKRAGRLVFFFFGFSEKKDMGMRQILDHDLTLR